MSEDFNDSLEALFEGDKVTVSSVRPPQPVRAIPEYKTAEQRFIEGCPKCRGSGNFVSYSGRIVGPCFACKGVGSKTFKSSGETRAANREKSAMKKEQNIEAFKAEFSAECEWLEKQAAKQLSGPMIKWQFPVDLSESLAKYGSLTDGQIAAIRKCIDRDAQRAAERSQRVASAPAVDQAGIDRLKESFDKAVAYSAEKGLKLSPRITIDGITISPAKAHSANPGALYVKAGSEYLGKIVNAKFYATAAATTEHEAKLALFLTNPAEAAKVYGQTTGTCCICNATLRSEWKLRGIGPICAEKFGWA